MRLNTALPCVPRIIICIQNINKFKKKLVVLKPVVLYILHTGLILGLMYMHKEPILSIILL